METVLITGGTGLIGKALTKELIKRGYKVIILSRHNNSAKSRNEYGVSYAQWDVQKGTIDEKAIQQSQYIVHLAGANVADGRWTDKRKKIILESRTKTGALIVKALNTITNNIKAVISASAIGWYGEDPQIPNPNPFTETATADDSFLGNTCLQWEESLNPVVQLGKRLVKLRTGIVLSNDDGAFKEFKKPLTFGAATILGSGNQVVSWIHITDMVLLYIYAIENTNLEGVYNAVAPQPVSNKELILSIAKYKGGIAIPVHVPQFALKIALGEMSIEVLKSATVSSKKIEAAGYNFMFPTIESAVQNLLVNQ